MKTAYINATLLNGKIDMEPINNTTILVDDGIITKIEEGFAPNDDYEIIDLKDSFLMPGLINLHIHLPGSGKPKKKETDLVKLVKLLLSNPITKKVAMNMCENFAKTQLLSGVTTVRTVGGLSKFDSIIRDKIAKGKIIGPRILASNMAISVPGGHMAGSLAYEATTEEEAKEFVRIIAKDNPDLIKLMITGGVLDAKAKGEPGEVKMQGNLVKAACDEAHKLGLKVAAHVESTKGVRLALENGVDTIEHGSTLTKKEIDLFKEKKASHICTLSPALPFALFSQEISKVSDVEKFNGILVFQGIIDCAKKALENNIPVGLGTDTGCPYITHYDMYRELIYFAKYVGVSNKFALHTATEENAKIAQIDHVTGTIEKGKCADFIVTKENPLKDLKALRDIEMVVSRGNIIKAPKVKKMEEVEAELNKFI